MPPPENVPLPRRPLGRTGREVTLFGLGGEGVLRTRGRNAEAVAVIRRALEQGVNYFDTAPAYADSRDYYGAALGERRRDVFLASKTHDRTRDGSLALLEDMDASGLLKDTLVILMGEFGRSPRVTPATAGREHWPFVFTVCGAVQTAPAHAAWPMRPQVPPSPQPPLPQKPIAPLKPQLPASAVTHARAQPTFVHDITKTHTSGTTLAHPSDEDSHPAKRPRRR